MMNDDASTLVGRIPKNEGGGIGLSNESIVALMKGLPEKESFLGVEVAVGGGLTDPSFLYKLTAPLNPMFNPMLMMQPMQFQPPIAQKLMQPYTNVLISNLFPLEKDVNRNDIREEVASECENFGPVEDSYVVHESEGYATMRHKSFIMLF